MMYPVGGVPPDGGVHETAMLLLKVKWRALRSVGGLGAAVAYMRDNYYLIITLLYDHGIYVYKPQEGGGYGGCHPPPLPFKVFL